MGYMSYVSFLDNFCNTDKELKCLLECKQPLYSNRVRIWVGFKLTVTLWKIQFLLIILDQSLNLITAIR